MKAENMLYRLSIIDSDGLLTLVAVETPIAHGNYEDEFLQWQDNLAKIYMPSNMIRLEQTDHLGDWFLLRSIYGAAK